MVRQVKNKLKKYFVTAIFADNKNYFDIYDDAFDVWAYNKIEAEWSVLNYYKQGNIEIPIHVEVMNCPFATIISRLRKKVPDAPICKHI